MAEVRYRGEPRAASEINFDIRREAWNVYQLEDGTEIRMRLVVSEVLRVEDEYDQDGKPVYVVKSSNVITVRPPDHLMKPRGGDA